MLYDPPIAEPAVIVPITKQTLTDVLDTLVASYGDETVTFQTVHVDIATISLVKAYTKRVEALALAGDLPVQGNTFSDVTIAEATAEYLAMRVYTNAPDNNWYKDVYDAIVAANPTWTP